MTAPRDFWSRRKAAVQAEEAAQEAMTAAEALEAEHAALAEKTEEEVLQTLGLPDPDTLSVGDDFTAFMAKAVPEAIRRRALRTLWRSNPVLANVDMLVDYGEDFTDKAMAVENIQTAYQVGKGMLSHVEEMARKAAAALEEAEAPEPEEEVTETAAPDEIMAEAEVQQAPAWPDDEDMDAVAHAPRRMTFHIEETA